MLLGNVRSLCRIFENVFCRFFPRKGVRPYNISYSSIPAFCKQVMLRKWNNNDINNYFFGGRGVLGGAEAIDKVEIES